MLPHTAPLDDAADVSPVAHKLRVLIVDDNQINLSVLSMLLKRRFSALLDSAPVTVDSGLKAIQLLRTNVFDLILMDIQMPFLSGLDATLRIRNGEDDVLEANVNAHIVAVTTAVGAEPEAAYRRAGMDGMIGKPVRFQDMHHYLSPLAREARHAAQSIATLVIDGNAVMPPLPPVSSRSQRLFYLPADSTIRAPCPDICKGADFEMMLRAQTRASLRKSGAMAVGRSATKVGRSPTRRQAIPDGLLMQDRIHEEDCSSDASIGRHRQDHGGKGPVNTEQVMTDAQLSPRSSRLHSHSRTMSISKFTLSAQIQREMDNLDGHESDANDTVRVRAKSDKRPLAVHRASSPACLMTPGGVGDAYEEASTPALELPITSGHLTVPSRPKWLLALKESARNGSNDTSTVSRSSSISDSSCDSSSPATTPSIGFFNELRRESQQSCGSDFFAEISTPASESGSWDLLNTIAEESGGIRQRAESSSSNGTVAGFAGATLNVKSVSNVDAGELIESSALNFSASRNSRADEMDQLFYGIRNLGMAP